jgi:serine phosphatase RsbU (regulator of sigma subunit)
MNPKGDLLGNDRMLQLMSTAASQTSKEVIKMLTEAVNQFRDGAEPNDDLTLMCLHIT